MGSINMENLPSPTSKPAMGTIIPKGHYHAKIVKSEMKSPKDESRPDYFSAECDITDPVSNTAMGKFWINLFESDAPLVKWQLSRFIYALQLPIQGSFELKDLTKMVNGKELEIDIKPEVRNDDKPPQRSVVDIDADCYYPVGTPTMAAAEAVFAPETAQAPPVMASY